MKAPAIAATPAIDHYENFPVASWLCPAYLRAPIAAIYGFARTADDLADEGTDAAAQRLSDLAAYRAELAVCAAGREPSPRWRQIFQPLGDAIRRFALPLSPLEDLLNAFCQDVVKTRDGAGYADRAELLDYCRRSANPVGRLLLHLYGIHEAEALARSDSICTALQLTNFWQDLSVDVPRRRFYLPASDCHEHGMDPFTPASWPTHPRARQLIAAQVQWTRGLMSAGAPLVRRVPGRAGWELRLVVQGGLRILDRIEAIGFDSFRVRPRLGAADLPVLLWRAIRM